MIHISQLILSTKIISLSSNMDEEIADALVVLIITIMMCTMLLMFKCALGV